MRVDVFLASGFEESEAIIVIDILRRMDYLVNLISISDQKEVLGGHKVKVIADYTLDNWDIKGCDALFLPGGGLGVENLSKSQKVLDIVKECYENGKYIIAICAAPMVLEKSGILKDKSVTSYPSVREKLKSIKNYSEDKVVIDKKIITSRGFGTAIDLGLEIVKIFSSDADMKKLKESIVY